MGQNILPCINAIIWKKPKESEHLTRIPKPHLSTSLSEFTYSYCFNTL